MTEAELKGLSIKELLALADKAIELYIAAASHPNGKRLAEQRQADLYIIDKVIKEKEDKEKKNP
jgi:predicted RNase H-like HicB family nuclease